MVIYRRNQKTYHNFTDTASGKSVISLVVLVKAMIPCRTLIIAPGQGSFQDDGGVTNWYYKNNESVITISALQKIVRQGACNCESADRADSIPAII
jgi:hypothetical protein